MSASRFAATPEPPYFAVIFTSQRTDGDHGYGETANRMMELASQQAGYLGVEYARDASGFGITVSYWKDLDSITKWRAQATHAEAQKLGRSDWYTGFELRIAKVERAYNFRAVAPNE